MLIFVLGTRDSTSQKPFSPLQSISLKESKTTGSKKKKGQALNHWQRQNQSNTELGPVPPLQKSHNHLDTFSSLRRNVTATRPAASARNRTVPLQGEDQQEVRRTQLVQTLLLVCQQRQRRGAANLPGE